MISRNVQRLLDGLPDGVTLVAAAKTRTPDEIREAVEAGVRVVGENYVQEAESAIEAIGRSVAWHFIGHLQRNKASTAVGLFDMIETVDSVRLAEAIDRACVRLERTMSVLIEVNSGREPQKAGVLPEDVEALARELVSFDRLRLRGLMTMGPAVGDPDEARPGFRATKHLFDTLARARVPGAEMAVLSMGMSNSYRVAIEEGATMVRIGTGIFGARAR